MEEEQFNKFSEALKKIAEMQKESASENVNIVRDIASEIRSLIDLRKKENQALKNQPDLVRSLRKELSSANKIAEESYNFTEDRISLLSSEEDLQKKLVASRKNILGLEREIAILERRKNEGDLPEELVKKYTKIQEALFTLKGEAKEFDQQIKNTLESVKTLEQSGDLQFFKNLQKLSNNIPILEGFFSKIVEDTRKSNRELQVQRELIKEILESKNIIDYDIGGDANADYGIDKSMVENLKKEFDIDLDDVLNIKDKNISDLERSKKALEFIDGKKFKNASRGSVAFSSISKSIKAAFSSTNLLLGGIGLLISEIGRVDKEVVELQKSFAASGFEAVGIRTELALAAAESGNINITTSKLLANLTELSKEFGFVAKFSSDTLVTMTKLTEQVGLTAQEAAQLAAAAEISDQSFEDIYQNVLGASYELQQQAGVQFDLREILKATNSVTGQVRANLAANPEAIAKAVTQAKLFGAQLDDIVNSSRALLDFQSSIERELEAELLLGRDLNLERARSAALLGDQETVAKELAAQAQDFTAFTKLNVLQQDALASSLGMQSDQLSDILFKQEVQGKTARELRALGKEDLAQRLEQQTLIDKFAATLDKLKGVVSDVAVAFLPVVRVLGAALSLVGALVGGIRDIIVGIGVLTGLVDDFGESGLISGLKGAAGSLGITEMNDGIIPSSGEGSIISRPEGAIKLNPKDTIVAGTDLFGDRRLSQMPDYNQVINETKLGDSTSTSEVTNIEPLSQTMQTINQMQAPLAPTNTAANTLIEDLIAEQKRTQEAIKRQTEVLAKGQDTIAKTKTKLQVGATDFGTELNVNSFRIQ